MGRLKYSREVARGNRPKRKPSEYEADILFLVGSGITQVGELIKELASTRRLPRSSVERIVKSAILAGILELISL